MMTTKTVVEKKNRFVEWKKTILTIVVSAFIALMLSLLQHSYEEGQFIMRITLLEKSNSELKQTDINLSEKLDRQLEKIHNLELLITEMKASNLRQEDLLLEIKKRELKK